MSASPCLLSPPFLSSPLSLQCPLACCRAASPYAHLEMEARTAMHPTALFSPPRSAVPSVLPSVLSVCLYAHPHPPSDSAVGAWDWGGFSPPHDAQTRATPEARGGGAFEVAQHGVSGRRGATDKAGWAPAGCVWADFSTHRGGVRAVPPWLGATRGCSTCTAERRGPCSAGPYFVVTGGP